MDNAILKSENNVPARIAQRTLAKRGAGYASEVRRLLDAALEVMRQGGTASRPRVADIVAAAGLSNDAFYRHFPSKDALVAALLEDGAERLASYVTHQMDKEPAPAGKVRRWVEGVLSQTREEIAATTLAVLWNGGSIGESFGSGRHSATAPLAALLHEPFAQLGSADPELDASLREAGVSPAGLLHHFESKEQLLNAVLDVRDDDDDANANRTGDILEEIENVTERFRRSPGLIGIFTVLLTENLDPDAPLHGRFGQVPVGSGDGGGGIRRGQRAGRYRANMDPVVKATEIVAFLYGMETSWLLDPSVPLTEVFREYTESLARQLVVDPTQDCSGTH